MGTAFDTETLRRGIESHDAKALLSLYADDAEIRVVDRNSQPSRPMVMHGQGEISRMLDDVYGRDMTHKVERCVVQEDTVAYTESCEYPDGVRVLASSMMSLKDGKIVDQTVVQAWDE